MSLREEQELRSIQKQGAQERAEEAIRLAQQALKEAQQAKLEAQQAERDVQQAERDVQQAEREVEQAEREVEQAERDVQNAQENVQLSPVIEEPAVQILTENQGLDPRAQEPQEEEYQDMDDEMMEQVMEDLSITSSNSEIQLDEEAASLLAAVQQDKLQAQATIVTIKYGTKGTPIDATQQEELEKAEKTLRRNNLLEEMIFQLDGLQKFISTTEAQQESENNFFKNQQEKEVLLENLALGVWFYKNQCVKALRNYPLHENLTAQLNQRYNRYTKLKPTPFFSEYDSGPNVLDRILSNLKRKEATQEVIENIGAQPLSSSKYGTQDGETQEVAGNEDAQHSITQEVLYTLPSSGAVEDVVFSPNPQPVIGDEQDVIVRVPPKFFADDTAEYKVPLSDDGNGVFGEEQKNDNNDNNATQDVKEEVGSLASESQVVAKDEQEEVSAMEMYGFLKEPKNDLLKEPKNKYPRGGFKGSLGENSVRASLMDYVDNKNKKTQKERSGLAAESDSAVEQPQESKLKGELKAQLAIAKQALENEEGKIKTSKKLWVKLKGNKRLDQLQFVVNFYNDELKGLASVKPPEEKDLTNLLENRYKEYNDATKRSIKKTEGFSMVQKLKNVLVRNKTLRNHHSNAKFTKKLANFYKEQLSALGVATQEKTTPSMIAGGAKRPGSKRVGAMGAESLGKLYKTRNDRDLASSVSADVVQQNGHRGANGITPSGNRHKI